MTTFNSSYQHLKVPDQWNEYFSKYPNGYTILEAVINWAGQVNDMTDTLNSTTAYVNDFMTTFDTDLDKTTKDTLTQWQTDGTLATIITQALQTDLGDITTLTTNDKSSAVKAINEIKSTLGQVSLNLKETYGAKGDRTTDDTTAIQNALNDLNTAGGGRLYIPEGTYLITAPLTIYSNITIEGHPYKTQLLFNNSGYLFSLTNLTQIHFKNIRVTLNMNGATAFYVSNSFRCTWETVITDGLHTDTTGSSYYDQIGFQFRNNAGDNRIINCDLNNLGAGIQTSAIMNYVMGSVFGSCYKGLWGDSGSYGAGMAINECTFVSNATATSHHILVEVNANLFWITNTWFEGAGTVIQIGKTGVGGPYSFGLINCKLAGTNYDLDIQNALMCCIENCTFESDPNATPVELNIDSTGAINGQIINCRSFQNYDLDFTKIPTGWTVLGRGAVRFPTINGNVTAQGRVEIDATDATKPALKVVGQGAPTSNQMEIYRGSTLLTYIDQYNNLHHTSGAFFPSLSIASTTASASASVNTFFVDSADNILKFKDAGGTVHTVTLS